MNYGKIVEAVEKQDITHQMSLRSAAVQNTPGLPEIMSFIPLNITHKPFTPSAFNPPSTRIPSPTLKPMSLGHAPYTDAELLTHRNKLDAYIKIQRDKRHADYDKTRSVAAERENSQRSFMNAAIDDTHNNSIASRQIAKSNKSKRGGKKAKQTKRRKSSNKTSKLRL